MLLKLWGKCSINGGLKSLQFIHGCHPILMFSTSSTEIKPCFSNYLVNSLGFSKQQSLSISSKLSKYRISTGLKKVNDFNFTTNANSVIEFLQQHGFNQSHIRKLVSVHPQILVSNVDKTLKPKIMLLQDIGLSRSHLVDAVSKNYKLLTMNLGPTIKVLREIMGSDENVVSFLRRSYQNACCSAYTENLPRNVALLENSYGISREIIQKHLCRKPDPFFLKTELFQDIVIRTEVKFGIPQDSKMFLYGVDLIACFGEQNVESKFETLKSFGWTQTDVLALIRQNPCALMSSAARIGKSMHVLMNKLGYKPDYLAKHCFMLTCSIEKRIIPRNKVLLFLKEKGFVKKDYSLHRTILLTEQRFLEKFVLPFDEVHELYAKLTNRNVNQLTERPPL